MIASDHLQTLVERHGALNSGNKISFVERLLDNYGMRNKILYARSVSRDKYMRDRSGLRHALDCRNSAAFPEPCINNHQVWPVPQRRNHSFTLLGFDCTDFVTHLLKHFCEQHTYNRTVFDEQNEKSFHLLSSPPAPPSLTQFSMLWCNSDDARRALAHLRGCSNAAAVTHSVLIPADWISDACCVFAHCIARNSCQAYGFSRRLAKSGKRSRYGENMFVFIADFERIRHQE